MKNSYADRAASGIGPATAKLAVVAEHLGDGPQMPGRAPASAGKMMEKTTEEYWSARWANGATIPGPVNPTDRRLGNHVRLAYHRYFEAAFADLDPLQASLLEIGCARSRWLPYFRRQFGFAITGLDYSDVGCRQARAILDAADVQGDVVRADLFEPAEDLLARFDVVVSFGVVEHFDDTAACLKACARFLKPGGRMLTFIPNMLGSIGLLQRWISRPVYEMHVPLSVGDLAAAHHRAGLLVASCRYLLFANWGVVSLGNRPPRMTSHITRHLLSAASKTCWRLERSGLHLPPNPVTSPYIACMASLPGRDVSAEPPPVTARASPGATHEP